MAVTAYVIYELFWLNGEGHQPYGTIQQKNMGFEGGLYRIDEKYFGYLTGDVNKKDITIAACAAFQMTELTSAEALVWAEQSIPTDQANGIGPPAFDQNGYITRNTEDVSQLG